MPYDGSEAALYLDDMIYSLLYFDEVDDWPIINNEIEYGTTNLDEIF